MRVAREGYPFILTAGGFSAAAFLLEMPAAGLVISVVALAFAGFFRDPERTPPGGEGLVVSPADGKVVGIARVKDGPLLDNAETRVSIFLSPLDVHINRIPVAGKIEGLRYQSGKFLAAYKAMSSEQNEQNALAVVDSEGRKLGVVQIAGVLARRIVCRAKMGDSLARGERFGLIMFGSRTDLYLPRGSRIEVDEGQRVRGGETIIARFA